MQVTFLLCDDHALFREGLVLLIERQPGWQVVAQAGDGNEAVRLTQELKPDLAVLDVAMPEVSGIDAAKAIHAACPDTTIIALSMYGSEHYQKLMFNAGARAYVLKSQAGAELCEAIRVALRGEIYISPSLRVREPLQPQQCADQDLAKLTLREREVLLLLANGNRIKDVAKMLDISPKTVETYRNRIMLKCGFANFTDLVKFAIRTGIVRVE
jgi:DNA-binding NarL/FixJ family response regulator